MCKAPLCALAERTHFSCCFCTSECLRLEALDKSSPWLHATINLRRLALEWSWGGNLASTELLGVFVCVSRSREGLETWKLSFVPPPAHCVCAAQPLLVCIWGILWHLQLEMVWEHCTNKWLFASPGITRVGWSFVLRASSCLMLQFYKLV